ncbi:TPM domain-containing protein [Cellulomonas pakistanensis]|uniref:Membrane protein n=1 Tax=Cellulomonas pakistanensis TaxID=992287 RepID=A0A919PE49_9CELL|nr:TPM domain-containing protein [Cellulomonas pakistanensis]GIG36922.1 membrane protein [Cellulomonas pakistanensis]
MPLSPRAARRTRATAALAAVGSAALLVAGPAAGPASAEPPLDLPSTVTDTAGVLSPEDRGRVAEAAHALAEATPYDLFVVFVDSFDGMSNRDWADATAEASGLGRDDILLAVAVGDRRYQVSVDADIALGDDALTRVEQEDIEPALGDDDWAGAAVAAAEGYERAANPPAGAGTIAFRVLLALGVLALLGYGVARLVRTRRAAARAAAELDALDDRSARALVGADDAVAAAAQEVAFAEAEFGAEAAAPFAAALAQARELLAEAFRSRQLLDDDEHDTDVRRSSLAYAVLDGCARVEEALAAQRGPLVELRALHERAPQDLAAARDEAAALGVRAAETGTVWDAVRPRYAPAATDDVPGVLADATALAARAGAEADAGLALVDTDRVAAVAHVGEARTALARAAAVLDALDQRARDLETAPQAIAAVVAEIDADLVDAARFEAPGLAELVAAARGATGRAGSTEAGQDPLAVLGALREAEQALDGVLDPLRETEAARAHALERLPQATSTARARIAAVEATMARNRWSIGATTRTRLAEAARLTTQGEVAASSDPIAALRVLRAAAQRAEEAQRAAQADIAAAARRAAAVSDDGPSWGLGSGGSRRSGSSWSGGGRSGGTRSRSRSGGGRSGGGRSGGGRSSSRSGGGRRGGGGRF